MMETSIHVPLRPTVEEVLSMLDRHPHGMTTHELVMELERDQRFRLCDIRRSVIATMDSGNVELSNTRRLYSRPRVSPAG